jgi:hypothetical protein
MSNRRHLLRLTVAVAACLGVPAGAARAQFEGTITMRLSSANGGGDMQYSIKGDRMRIDVGTAQMGMYILADNGQATMVMPGQKIYFQPTLPSPAGQAKAASKVSIKATGRTETIAGYKCEHYTITGEDGAYDACLSRELGTFMRPMNPMGGRGAADASSDVLAHLGGNAFPLKVQKPGGATTLEVTKIEKKPLDASLFTVPTGYRKLDIGAMRGMRPPA